MRTEGRFSMGAAETGGRMASCDCNAVLDLEGRFVAANEDLAGFLGASLETLRGEDFERFIDAVVPRAILDDLWRTLSAGASWSSAVAVRSLGGAVHWMMLTAVPDMHRGVTNSYLVQLRPAFGAEIERARAVHSQLLNGVEFVGGQIGMKGVLAGSRLGSGLRRERLAVLATLVVALAVVLLLALAMRPDLATWAVRAIVSVLGGLVALGGIGVIVMDQRQRRREYQVVCGLIDRIAQGDIDAGGMAFNRIRLGGLRDALRRLQVKLSIAAYGGRARKPGAEQPEEPVSQPALLASRLRLVEVRCAEVLDLWRRSNFSVSGTAAGQLPSMERLVALSEGLAGLRSSLLVHTQTSRKSRVLGLNLGLLEGRADIKGIGRLHRTAMSVAREYTDGMMSVEQELDRLQRELGALIETIPTTWRQPESIAVTMEDALAGLLEELRALRSSVDGDSLGLRPVSDVTVESREAAYSRESVRNPAAVGQQAKKVSRLKAVGATPVPRVGRDKRGGPLEEDWGG